MTIHRIPAQHLNAPADRATVFEVHDNGDITIVDTDGDTVITSVAELQRLIVASPRIAPSLAPFMQLFLSQFDNEPEPPDPFDLVLLKRGRQAVIDELRKELTDWRTNNLAFRQRKLLGSPVDDAFDFPVEEPSLASAMMADERRVAIDKVLGMLINLERGLTPNGRSLQ